MSSLSYTIFLGLFLAFSLGLYFISYVLDMLTLTASQKLVVLKTGLLFLTLAPLIFIALDLITFKSIEIKMPNLYIDPSTAIPQSLPQIRQKIYWPFYVSLLYGIGISIVLLKLVRGYFVTRQWLSDSCITILQGQSVRLSSHITSPLSFGFSHPQIYFPRDVQTLWTSREIQIGLSHEQNHIARHDPLWKLISLFVRSLLFFAPWMYALHNKLELEMEMLCDESTCMQTQATIEEYGNLLLNLSCQSSPKSLLVTNITDSTIKRRIIAMKSRKIQRPIFTAILSACMLLVGTTAIATSSGITEKKSVFKISSVMLLNGKEVSKPRIIVTADETASIMLGLKENDESIKMELIASDVSMPNLENAIGIRFDILYRIGNYTDHVNTQVLLAPNKEGTITVTEHDGQLFEMRLMAERQ